MASYFLSDSYERFLQESTWLVQEFLKALGSFSGLNIVDRLALLAAEMAVIRLYDSWARFNRNVVILSAGAEPYTLNGVRVPLATGISSVRDVVPVLLSRYRTRKQFEPRWARPNDSIDAAHRLQIQNFGAYSAAIGSVSSPSEDIRVLRNFFAHRGHDTADEVRNRGICPSNLNVNVENVAGKIVFGGITCFERWAIDLHNISRAAIQ